MMINTNATEPSAKADFTVGGISGRFRTLSMLEWKYIFNGKNDRSRTASVCGITGKVVAPDDFSGTLADSYDSAKWAVAESQGVVFFPAAGSRFDTEIWKKAPMAITGPQRLGITIMHRWHCSIVNIRSSTLWKRYAGKAAPSGM